MMTNFTDIDERYRPHVVNRLASADGTRKYLIKLQDGTLFETAGIPHGNPDSPDRLTVCFSTQAGCAMGCAFCATGRQGLTRNLESAEMVWQVAFVAHDFGKNADSAIAMGQGEPLANYAALADAIRFMNQPEGLGISFDELIVSTCGLPDGIRALADDDIPVTLAVSLHAARQELRDELMPGVRAFPLERLHTELARYNKVTNRHVIVQYLMLDGVNDRDEDRDALESFCNGLDARVSLLRFNRAEGIPYSPSNFGLAVLWSRELSIRGIPTSINKPRGADIYAACGQLVARAERYPAV